MIPLKIMLVDDHQLFLEGLQELIEQESDMRVVATANTAAAFWSNFPSQLLDVLVLDIQLPDVNGLVLAADLLAQYPGLPILLLSMYQDRAFIQRAYNLGVMGYLVKNSKRDELLSAIRAVGKKQKYYRQDVALSFLEKKPALAPGLEVPVLSKRETEILILIAKEYSNPAIAQLLHLSVETVNTHRKKLLQKLGVKNTAGLVKFAVYNKLISD